MLSRLPLFLLLIVVVIAANGCSNSTETVTIGASMTGSVKIYNTDLAQYDSARGGVTVALFGTSLHTTTDAAGNWKLDGVAPGIYTIVFTKAGYDTALVSNHKFSGAGVDFIDPVTLHFLATGGIVLDSIAIRDPLNQYDSNVTVYGTSHSTSATDVELNVNTNTAPGSEWETLENFKVGAGQHFAVRLIQGQIKFSEFHDMVTGGQFYFQATALPKYGSEVTSNILSLDIPTDVLIIDSITLNGMDPSIGDSTFVISGRFIADSLTFSLFATKDTKDTLGRQIPATMQRTGRNFRIASSVKSIEEYLGEDPNGFTAWFRVWAEGNYISAISNKRSIFLPHE